MAVVLKASDKKYKIENNTDKTILELARNKHILLKTSCGGNGKCGSCICYLEKGKFRTETDEKITILNNHPVKALSCKTKILSNDAVISIPDSSIIKISGNIIDDFLLKHYKNNTQTKKYCLNLPEPTLKKQISDRQRIEIELYKQILIHNIYIPLDVLKKLPDAILEGQNEITVTLGRIRDYWFMINIESGNKVNNNFAVALDIGTTTVVGVLIDLVKGDIIGRASLYNKQICIADDVVSRISYCKNQNDVDTLQDLIVQKTVNPIINELCRESNILRKNINRIAVSGNTVMIHLFLGLNPINIGKAPFQPVTQIPGEFQAKEIGIDITKNGIIDLIPSISGYIGGDITSDIYVSKIHKAKGLTILIDIGTNGEIVLSENGKLMACSTAAGPAFEGYGLYHGCRACGGSIEKISFNKNNEISFKTIDNNKPIGICGTGFIDFIAAGFKIGLINESGLFNLELLKTLNLDCVITKEDKRINACIIANKAQSSLDEPVVILESDISKILQAKAAIYAGLKILFTIQNKGFHDIKKLILAGGFARHINIENAILIGLIPDIPINRIEVIGNSSLGGAFLSIIEPNSIENMISISSIPDVIELNMHEEFQSNYIDALFLPNINKDDFTHILHKIKNKEKN